MNRQVNLLSFLIIFPILVFAQIKNEAIIPLAKSPYLTSTDTIMVNVGLLNQKTFNHQIKRGQTLYGLTKFFGITMEDIFFYNPNLRKEGLSLYQFVELPITNRSIIRRSDQELDKKYYIPVCYIVRPQETLYKISKTYFSMSPLLLQQNNEKVSTNLGVGDTLLIGWMKTDGILQKSSESQSVVKSEIQKANTPYFQQFTANQAAKSEVKENGIAYWKEQGTAKGKINFLALHRSAPMGSILKILNPMTGKILYAKVTGRIPNSTYEPTIKVVISPSIAKGLGAIDPKFHVKITYLK